MLQLTLLGSPSAALDGIPLTGKLLNKDLGLLYYLAAASQPGGLRQSRAALAVLLWGDHPEAAAHASLRKSLSNLRQQLGCHIAITRYNVMLVREHCAADLWEFECLAAKGLAASDQTQLDAAAALYRGAFLAGFGVHAAVDFDDWSRAQQERLRGIAVQILATLAAAYAAGGDLAQAIAAQRRILELEPWLEESHRELLLLLAQSGQRSAALAQYRVCVETLAAELGVEPSPATTAAAARIADAGEPAAALNLPAPPQLPVLTYGTLPREPSPIVGRERELGELAAMLLDPECRVVTILGMGGIGKTRLALALAHRLSGQYAHVAMVSLAAVTRAVDVLPALGRELLVAPGSGENSVIAALRRADPDLLLVLDNFEHLLPDGAAVLDQLLASVTHLRCVVTSREALSTRWEWRYPLGELSFPAEVAEVEPATYSSVQLFLQIARRTRPGHRMEGVELRQVMRICRLVGGMPLGVELAAAQAGSLACGVIADQIAAGIDRLAADLRDLPLRQRSLAASFDASWATLTLAEQTILARLSVLQGEFTLEAALHIAEAAVADIARLVDKSLVRPVNGNLYSLHQVIRQHAAGRLAPGLAAAALAAYRAYYTGWAESNLHHYTTPALHYRETVDQLENHLQHLWYLWTNSTAEAERDQIAVALTETELARRSYLDTRTGTIDTWDGMQAFIEGYTQAAMTYTGVLVIDMVWLPWIADQLADITTEFTVEEVASWVPEMADACCVDGRLLAIPKDVDFGLLYYRSDLLDKHGITAPPATWDELERMAAVIQAGERAAGRRNFWGFIWPGQKPEGLTCTALEWQHSEGGGCIIERDGRVSIANERAAAALTRAARWVGTISPANFGDMTETDAIRTWENGDAAFMRLWTGYLAVRLRGAMKSATSFCILPRGAVRHAATLGGWPLVVHKSFRQRSEAFELLKAIGAPDVQRLRASQVDGSPPAILALYHDSSILAVHPFLHDVHKMIAGGGLAVRPCAVAGTLYTRVAALYAETVTSVLSGQVDAAPALADLKRQLVDLGGWPAADHT
jgi:predicted ATPase/ABC-type glycerol-3-phosphate transport system substrate-binding protein/DNA-binding SARP family transcriptional activator